MSLQMAPQFLSSLMRRSGGFMLLIYTGNIDVKKQMYRKKQSISRGRVISNVPDVIIIMHLSTNNHERMKGRR